jgi:HlyD family secretion protein
MLSQRRLGSLALLLIGAGLLYLWLRVDPVQVDVATVARGPLQVTVDEEGETRVRERFVVAAPVSGRLERLRLDAGDAVQAGQVVAEMVPQSLDPRFLAEARARRDAAVAQTREAEARVAQAAAALAQAQRTAGRARRLAENKTISSEELEVATLEETTRARDLDAARAAARTAEYNLEATEAALLASGEDVGPDDRVALRSPVGGAVLRLFEESARVLPVGTPVLEVGNPNELEIVIDVLSTEAVKVRPGARVLIEDWGGDGTLEARVRRVEPSGFTKVSALGVEEQRVNVIADFVAANAGLGDAYRLEARIVVWDGEEVLQVPSGAIFRARGAWRVFVVADGKAAERIVRLGHRTPLAAEVVDGIAAGETVIVHPSDLVADGVPVTATQRNSQR